MAVEYSIRSEQGAKNKEKLWTMIQAAGYENYRQFCKDAGIDCSNLYSNLDGTWKMSLRRMFKVANLLKVPITNIIEIFYPEEFAENQKSSC